MPHSRRDFVKTAALAGIRLPSSTSGAEASPPRPELVCRVNVFTNQLGYLTRGGKKFVVESTIDPLKPDFYIRDTEYFGEDHRVFKGQLKEFNGDFGRYWIGDFTEFQTPGKYVIDLCTNTTKNFYSSEVFPVADDVYRIVIEKGLECFALQRCGPSTTGYHAPCHLDDGIRVRSKTAGQSGTTGPDEGEFFDAVGGWHDASDLLKWTSATITGMVGLLHIAEHFDEPQMQARIFEEVKWGNLYFLKLQDPLGYFYSHGVGGDPVEEGNHWTDNIRGTADDRKVVTEPGEPYLQHLFITAQARLSLLYRAWDEPYAKKCLEAATRCFRWVKEQKARSYTDFGTGAHAGSALFQATKDRAFLDYAATMADRLVGLQETQGQLNGYFYEDDARIRGVPHVYAETLAMIGLCRLIEEAKDKLDVLRWQKALALYCDNYVLTMAERNAFGIVPYQVNLEKSLLSGARSLRGTSYRYFMCHLNGQWWVGNNAHLAGTGVILSDAARILGSEQYRNLGQRMFDWILGLNPFDVSTVNGLGHKNPPEYVYTGFKPRTPRITGSVMCGIAGDAQDRPDLQAGSYHSGEIWTPMTIQTMWLASELAYYSRSREKAATTCAEGLDSRQKTYPYEKHQA